MPDKLKKDWTRVAFGDVVRLSRERSSDPLKDSFERYVGLEHLDPEDLKIRRWGNVADGTTFTSVFRAGQVLFGKRRAYQKKLAVPDFEGLCSGDIYVLEPKNKHLLPELLPFICQTDSFFDHAVGTSAGSLSPRTNWKSLAEYEFALPPLDEQKRIAEVLRGSVNLIIHLDNANNYAKLAGNALLDTLFSSYFMKHRQQPTKKNNKLGWINLGSLVSLQTGYPFKSKDFSNAGDRLLRCSNVGVDRTIWNDSDTRYWPTYRRSEVSEFILSEEDIVIAMDRPFIGSGFKVAMLTKKDLPALLVQRVGRFKVISESMKKIVWAFVHSKLFQAQLQTHQQGTDLPHISKSQIEEAVLPKESLERYVLQDGFWNLSNNIEMSICRLRKAYIMHKMLINRLLQ